jgi:thiamine-monophosphate kinase
MRESDLLQHIASRSADLHGLSGAFGQIVTGPGDDCAVMKTASGDRLLITVDQLVSGRHFAHDMPLDLIARKAVARSVSDIAAMGGTPAWGLATGLLPDGYPHGDDLFDAMARWGRHWGCPLIGGDIASGSDVLSLTVTIAGTMVPGQAPVLRSGARPGDLLWLTGRIGNSFASGRHASFEPRLAQGQWAAAASAHAMIDLSDGLGRDAARIGESSGVRLVIESASLPLHEGCRDWKRAVSEGEDYELLIALPEGLQPQGGQMAGLLGPIGRAEAAAPAERGGAWIRDQQGTEHDARELGWDHG